MNTIPERWTLVRVSPDMVKVMAAWSGGYLHGDSWKMNSGIESIEETDESYIFTGHSGSTYECRKGSYGINPYGAAVLAGADLQPMSEESALKYIKEQL